MNDAIINSLTLDFVNTTLYTALNYTIEEYNQLVYPYVQLYNENWFTYFEIQITQLGDSIINGTHLLNNNYENSSIIDAYTSQGLVLNQLGLINATV